MKYRLLQPLPGYEVGTVFEERTVSGLFTYFVDDREVPRFVSDLIANEVPSADWFQPIDDKPERWRAEEHDYFYFIDEYGDIEQDRERRGAMAVPEMTDKIYQYGNYFATEHQAQAAAEAIRAVLAGIHGNNQHYFDSQVREAYEAARQAVQKGRD